MKPAEKNAMISHIDGIIMGVRDHIQREIDEDPERYHEAVQILVDKARVFQNDPEEITHQFNTSYNLIVDNVVRLTALSLIDPELRNV